VERLDQCIDGCGGEEVLLLVPLVFRDAADLLWLCRDRLRRRSCRGLQHRTGEHPHLASTIALESKQSFTLADSEELHDGGEAPLVLVEVRIDAAQVLLDLPDVHGPSRRLRGPRKQFLRLLDDLLNLLGIAGNDRSGGPCWRRRG